MKTLKLLTYSTLTVLLFSCGGANTPASSLFEIQITGKKAKFNQNETVDINLKNKKNKTINAITYTIDGEKVEVNNNKLVLNSKKVGNKTITAEVSYDDTTAKVSKKITVFAGTSPSIYTYEILNEYPHNPNYFTQGLEFYKDTLYESTGKREKSVLVKKDYKTGTIYKEHKLKDTQFGEGITILKDKIYHLTWQSNIGFVYDVNTFKEIDQFTYGKSREGWGFCNDGEKLYKSDGSEKIWTLNPDTLIEEDAIEVYTNSKKLIKINELEYVNGKIYANTWQSGQDVAVIIDPKSGVVEGIINFNGLKDKVTKTDDVDVLNGIAYNPTTKTFFVTGKNWDKMFEVNILKK
ncbi:MULTISPECIES: glutaminyl-peptide cyclotransferase [unclassified Cellulophaga]|uniref:glutaminyl-peptide cyclotransferase n=1 Tax=unclassified Cellulophaga TaxID=2634405 RepID=UPI0026E397B8|nr:MULTISPECIES: glutaminyl-peptide cyclotransferase [unclassified Cellulophaga]MDO6491509.1 glutaminyl-peptide cyclotransferase [Cellulophaga sp. 2_MG-2023]MDO6493386.1 glutaminyl-peptide cyclotransferase [Cellulophaga sp. 3_MG-2023]